MNVSGSGKYFTIRLFRQDPKDKVDEQINVDEYELWEELKEPYSKKELIGSVTTADDPQLKEYEEIYIYLIKHHPLEIPDHHRSELPTGIKILKKYRQEK